MASSTQSGKYAPCPKCKALNMAHRRTCYRCQSELAAGIWAWRPPVPSFIDLDTLPKDLETRKDPRRDVRIEQATITCEGVPTHIVMVRNISLGGAQVQTTLAIPKGASVTLEIPVMNETMVVSGVVLYQRPVEDGADRYLATGIQFKDLDPTALRLLGFYA